MSVDAIKAVTPLSIKRPSKPLSFLKNYTLKSFLVICYCLLLAAFFILSPYSRKSVKPLLIVVLLLTEFFIISDRKKNFHISERYLGKNIYFSFFLLVAVISMFLSKDFNQSRSILFERYIPYFLTFEIGRLFVLSKTVAGTLEKFWKIKVIEFVKYVFIVSGLLLGAGGVVDYVRFSPERLFSVFGCRIEFLMLPLYIVYFISIIYCLMFQGNTISQKFFSRIAFALLTICLILSGSRAAWIAGIAGMIFAAYKINKKKLRWFLAGLFLFLGLAYFLEPSRLNDFGTLLPRKDIFYAAVDIFRDNVFFGAGPGLYEKLVSQYSKGFVELHAHSAFIEILAELGIVGLLAFLAIFVRFYVHFFKNLPSVLEKSNLKPLFVGLVTSNFATLIFAIFGSIITVGMHDAPMFWLIFGLGFGLSQRLQEETESFRG